MLLRACAATYLVSSLFALPLPAHNGAKFEPPDGKVLHGVGQDDPAAAAWTAALNPGGATGIEPVVVKRYYHLYERKTEAWYQAVQTGGSLHLTWSDIINNKLTPLQNWLAGLPSGVMPEISIDFTPFNGVTPDQLIPSGTFNDEIEAVAHILAQSSLPMFVRIGFEAPEMGYTPGAAFIDSYRHIVDSFRAEGVDAAYILCAGPNSGDDLDDVDVNGDPVWYPGDEYVDWLGFDPLNPGTLNPANPNYAETDALLDFAYRRKKPVFLSESSASFLSTGGTGTSPSEAATAWTEFFGPFFALIANEPIVKGFAYINWDWVAHNYPSGWGDASVENNPSLVALLASELSNSRYLHRATTPRFEEPWFDDAHVIVQTQSPSVNVTIEGSNAQLSGGCGSSGSALIYVSSAKLLTGTNLTNQVLGTSAYSGQWFLDTTWPTPITPTTCSTSTGEFSLTFSVPSSLAGYTIYMQGLFAASGSGPVSLTGLLTMDCL